MDLEAVEQFAFKVASDQAIGTAGALAYLGDRLGLWAALAEVGPVTPDELAGITQLHPRYVREWLATQAAAEYLTYDPDTERFTLPPEHAAVLADDSSPAALAGGFEAQAAFWAVTDRVADAFRSGQGIAWGDQDPRLRSGAERFFRPLYAASIVDEWLPALDGVVATLERGGRVLDVGAGHGVSTLLMAQAFPRSTFHGIDPDPGSVAEARAAAGKAGVADRVTFAVATAEGDVGDGWDLVTYFDAFHHIGDPVAAARQARHALAPGGALMLVEPMAHDRLEDNLNMVGVTFYGASTLVCITDALAQDARVVLGGQAGPARLGQVLADAGFATVRTAHQGDFNLVIEARP